MSWIDMCMVFGGFACLVTGGLDYDSATVHVIYAIPSDRAYNPLYAAATGDTIMDVREWYTEQVGETFDIAPTSPQVCYLAHAAEHYAGEGGWGRITEDVQHCAPVRWFPQWETFVIYADVDHPCRLDVDFELGQGGGGIAILHSGNLHGISMSDSDTYTECEVEFGWHPRSRASWLGTLAHELGHALGLPHPAGCDMDEGCDDEESGNSVMWQGGRNYPDTYLLDVDKAYLREFFSNPVARCGEWEEWCRNNYH